jgi:hypothetical protein
VFRSTAEGETGHAHGHLEYLEEVGDPATGLPIGATDDNLKAAIAGETHEYTDMYPGMAKTARDEGFDEIADWFETLAKAEKSHANRFQKALDTMDRIHSETATIRKGSGAMREGSLEAPTRHPVPWRDPTSTTRPSSMRAAPRLRHLPRLPPLLQSVRQLSRACSIWSTSPRPANWTRSPARISSRSSTPARCATCAS